MISFGVRGEPRPQGSARAFVGKGGKRAIVTYDDKAGTLGFWRQRIATEAQAVMEGDPLTGPLDVTLYFTLPRPVSRSKKHHFPDKRPDIDKLARACLDGMTTIVFNDDGQIVTLTVKKRYLGDAGGHVYVGVVIAVAPIKVIG